jgi:superfamily II DNA or RNA helicase
MLLRPRQIQAVERSLKALSERGNTLLVAPTGSGKSVMMAAIAGSYIKHDGRVLLMQHRDELVDQNRTKFKRVVKNASTGVVNADVKQWDRQATFAMIQTVSRDKNLAQMTHQDLVVIDEGHRAPAASYVKVFNRAKEINPNVHLFVTTATPQRGDSKTLREIVDNVADQITLGELILAGHLVRPRTFVIDLGTQEELKQVRRTVSDFDMGAVERIMDKQPLNERVVQEWKKLAGDRRTIVFTSTVTHAKDVAAEFQRQGVAASYIDGETPDAERAKIVKDFDQGRLQVLVNCMVLTEGFDSQPVSCVILLRPSSHKSTMIQMIGRGLRTVDPELYPGVTKNDCIVIDFGISVLTHGSLEQDVVLEHRKKTKDGAAPIKICPECGATIPAGVFDCPICGFTFILADGTAAENVPPEALEDFILTEVDLFRTSPFKWEEIFDGAALVATAFDAWAMCVLYQGVWHALGGSRETGIKVLHKGERIAAVAAADDFLRNYGDTEQAGKAKRWLGLPVTDKQMQMLGLNPFDAMGMTRYRASCLLTFKLNERGIRARLVEASGVRSAA